MNRPQKKTIETILNTLTMMAATSQILVWTPQILKIFQTKNVESFSSISMAFIFASSSIWLLYGIFHSNRSIIISSASGTLSTMIILCSIFWLN